MPDFFLSPQQKFPVMAHLIICQTKFNNSIISRPNDGYASLNWVLIGSGNYGSSPLKFCTKPLTEAILINSQLNSWEYISMKFEMKFLIFLLIKCISKCHLQNFSHFVPTSIMLIQSVCTSPYLYNKTVSRLHTKAIHLHINALHMLMSPCTISYPFLSPWFTMATNLFTCKLLPDYETIDRSGPDLSMVL